MDEDTKTEYVILEPDWVSLCRWFAVALSDHTFEKFAHAPVVSFMEQIRYLAIMNPKELQKIIEEFKS